jgi:hypothetical protein
MLGPYSSRFHGVVLCSLISGPAPIKLVCGGTTKWGMNTETRGGVVVRPVRSTLPCRISGAGDTGSSLIE